MSTHGFSTTTDEVLVGVDLTGQRMVITGASTGLGEETARSLALHGAAITMAVRDIARETLLPTGFAPLRRTLTSRSVCWTLARLPVCAPSPKRSWPSTNPLMCLSTTRGLWRARRQPPRMRTVLGNVPRTLRILRQTPDEGRPSGERR